MLPDVETQTLVSELVFRITPKPNSPTERENFIKELHLSKSFLTIDSVDFARHVRLWLNSERDAQEVELKPPFSCKVKEISKGIHDEKVSNFNVDSYYWK